jgi:hypothetical protein
MGDLMRSIASVIACVWGWIKGNHEALQVFLTIGAIVLAWALYKQTQEQATISKKALLMSQDMMHRQLKAYVNVDSEIVPFLVESSLALQS